MKRIALVIVLATVTMIAIGQTKEEVTKMLSNPEAKMLVMNQISDDVTMSKEMMSKIMDKCGSDTVMRRHMMPGMMNACMGDTAMRQQMVSKMMESCKVDTTMRNCMMSGMMDACKSDSSMMRSMQRHMRGTPGMRDPMERRMKVSNDSKAVEGLDKTTLTVTRKKQ